MAGIVLDFVGDLDAGLVATLLFGALPASALGRAPYATTSPPYASNGITPAVMSGTCNLQVPLFW
ncbi:MAG: hypothetical protein EBS29_06775 [Chloroflexia bacterium]|nr:hypothetical protein [Chloroflexia bacterium]